MADGQRRLAAIMVADVVGYSRLMELDEAGTLAALKDRRVRILEPLVRRQGGRIVKVMGDGVLLEFASAVGAATAALELQAAIEAANAGQPEPKHIRLRIGINLGDVISEGTDIYGEGVNVAARLETLAEAGGICVSSKVMEELRGRLEVRADDLGEMQLKNIARPVRVFRLSPESSAEAAPEESADHVIPAIAVLPFVNMSGDPEQEFLADGLTEDIITALSRSSRLAVIARTSTFAYKGKTADIKKIAKELDVDFVLEGSVRRSGNRVRITAQLIDAASGHHLWAEKYDGTMDDLADMQDEITHSVAASTATQVLMTPWQRPKANEQGKAKAYRLARQGIAKLHEMTSATTLEGAQLAEAALQVDPDCLLGHHVRANALVLQLVFGDLPHSEDNVRRMLELAGEAVRRGPRNEWARWLMGFALAEAGRIEEALAECETALEINPNATMILGDKGDYLAMLGRSEEAIAACTKALRLNPRDPVCYWWENSIATAHFVAGDDQAAADKAKRVWLRKPDHVRAGIIWAAAAAALGREAEARQAVSECLALRPAIRLANVMPDCLPTFRRAQDRERLLDNLRKAGMPD